jgi:hypothetical protein
MKLPKLFAVTYMDDCEFDTYLTVGEKVEEVQEREEKRLEEELDCFMGCTAYEVSEVDGYLINVKEKSFSDGMDYKRG